MKLSEVQRKTLAKMGVGKQYSAFVLCCSISTLRALERRQLVVSRYAPDFAYPHTDILFSLTEAGQEVKRA